MASDSLKTGKSFVVQKKLSVLIADDHELVRQALKLHVEQLGDSVEISEANSYEDALAHLSREKASPPTMIILDLQMPGAASSDICGGLKQIALAAPTAILVVFSATDDPVAIRAALKTGVRGYIPKTTSGRSLVSALKFVLDGEIYVPPAVMAELSVSQRDEAPTNAEDNPLSRLSGRELNALKSLTKGMTNKEIAREMGLQDVTVKMHLRNAYRKIGAANRIEAVRFALEHGIEQQAVTLPDA